jgi:hypothetical protein
MCRDKGSAKLLNRWAHVILTFQAGLNHGTECSKRHIVIEAYKGSPRRISEETRMGRSRMQSGLTKGSVRSIRLPALLGLL